MTTPELQEEQNLWSAFTALMAMSTILLSGWLAYRITWFLTAFTVLYSLLGIVMMLSIAAAAHFGWPPSKFSKPKTSRKVILRGWVISSIALLVLGRGWNGLAAFCACMVIIAISGRLRPK